jgi:hypothetical protein
LNASIKAIYSTDYDASEQRILKRNGWTEVRQEVLVMTARGEGKTEAVAMFVAALMLFCPRIKITVFAQALRQAKALLAKIDERISSHPMGKGRVMRPSSMERLRVRSDRGDPTDIRLVSALPSKSETTRGFYSDLIVVDEMSFAPEKLFMETIVPTLQRALTGLVGISTPLGTDNLYSVLCTMMDHSDPKNPVPMFNVITSDKVCSECLLGEDPEACQHMDSDIVPWKSIKKVNRMAGIYERDRHLQARETKGIVKDCVMKAFIAKDVDRFIANTARGTDGARVRAIYVTVDPSGAGASELAVAGYAERDGAVDRVGNGLELCLLAASAESTGVEDDARFIHEVWRRLRVAYPLCEIVFIPEANLAKEAAHLQKLVRDDPHTVTMRHVKPGWFGVRKTHENTIEMHALLARMLAATTLTVSPTLIGMPPPSAMRKQGLTAGSPAAASYMLEKLRGQLHAFRYEELPRTALRQSLEKAVYRLTGKRGSTQNDDLCICVLMGPYWRQVFLSTPDPSYLQALERMGA